MKKFFALLSAILLLLPLISCGTEVPPMQSDTRPFTDSLNRTVEIPVQIERAAVTGVTAQLAIFALCPDKLVGLASAWDSSAAQYLDAAYCELPVLGQLYGGKGALNLETLLQSGAEVIVDVGEEKDGLADELESLQQQTGIPVIHISASLRTMGNMCRLLGELFVMPAEAAELAAYCDETYATGCRLAAGVEKVRALYVLGDAGQNVMARDSYHSAVFDLLCDNVAVLEQPSAKGTGNEVSLEQILLWNPDYIIFAPGSICGSVADAPAWRTLPAVERGSYCEAPFGPDNWMGFPPGLQCDLGLLWLGKILYGDAADYDLYTEVARFYRLFYHCELTQAQFDALVNR